MRQLFLVLALISAAAAVLAQAANDDAAAIKAAIAAQREAWNQGDIPAFMQAYENSPDTTFVGTEVRKGYGRILERYRRNYTDHAQMGP